MIREKTIKQQIRALKGVLRNERTAGILESLKAEMHMEVSITDPDGVILYGSDSPMAQQFPISDDNNEFALVKSNREQGVIVADLLSALTQKDLEKKRIGNEVLGLYREINMIYDFSEMLAEKIDVSSIAEMTLGEASQIIDSTHGLFLIHESETDRVVKLSSFGEDPNREENILRQNEVLKELIHRGTSSIVPYVSRQSGPEKNSIRSRWAECLSCEQSSTGGENTYTSEI